MKRLFLIALILGGFLKLFHAPWWLATVPFWPFVVVGITFGLFVVWCESGLAERGFQREIERNLKKAQGQL